MTQSTMSLDHLISRRELLKGSTAAGLMLLPGAAFAAEIGGANEIASLRAKIGNSFVVAHGSERGGYVLEKVVELAAHRRAPFAMARDPFILVFRHEAGTSLPHGTLHFSEDGITARQLLVSRFDDKDGISRLEAVFG